MKLFKTEFRGSLGDTLSAKIELPDVKDHKGFILFAHCFTCTKDLKSLKYMSNTFTSLGFATMRFDFTGLGESGGNFFDTSLETNIGDLKLASEFLEENYEAPVILIGHSFGGASAIFSARALSNVKVLVTMATPSELKHFARDLKTKRADKIEKDGSAIVTIAGNKYNLSAKFFDALENSDVDREISLVKKPYFGIHSADDDTLPSVHAEKLFSEAAYPKCLLMPESAGHLFLKEKDANFAARMIAYWAENYI